MKTVGFPISQKNNEKRRCLIPADIKNIKNKNQLFIETGYGEVLGYTNQDYIAVLAAAGTKWNFLPFKPGLVGGHCIGVDPYYLAQKAQEKGYHPEIILAGRRLNDSMGEYVASQVVKTMIKKNIKVNGAKVLNLGITFKENCPDVRNTKVVDVYKELIQYGVDVDIYDPWADTDEVMHEYGVEIYKQLPSKTYDAIIVAVAHNEFLSLDLTHLKNEQAVVYDIKSCLNRNLVDARL